MSGSTTNTCFTLARQPNAAAMALRASPGTRCRRAMRRLYMPPLEGVAYTAFVSRTAVSSARQTITSVRSAFSCAVSVRPRLRPPIVAVWKSASRRRVIIGRMRADDERDRQPPPLLRSRLIERAQIGGRIEIDSGLVPAAQHQAAHADVGPAVRGIEDEIDRGRDVRT